MDTKTKAKTKLPAVVEIKGGKTKFTDEQREEIRFLIRRAFYSHAGITPGRVARGLQDAGLDVSRSLAIYYMGKIRKDDAKLERETSELPDIFAMRARLRGCYEQIFNKAMASEGQLGQAIRA